MTLPLSTQAERYRQHAAAFALAQQLGITPREAEEKLRHDAAMERSREASRRLAAKMAAPIGTTTTPAEPSERPLFFWQKD
jgi:hypothetical protein